jgi:heavy metal translocating P-type ATPase
MPAIPHVEPHVTASEPVRGVIDVIDGSSAVAPRAGMRLPPLRRLLLAAVLVGLAAGFGVGRLAWDVPATLVALVVLADLVRGLRRGILGVDVIALLAIAGALALGEHLAAVIVALMVAGGSALEELAQARARRELAALLGRTPRIAHRQDGDRVVDIAIDAVAPDDLLVIKPGEIVPVDGSVVTEAATLDESALTGEAMPVTRAAGDAVRSGVVNVGAPFTLRAAASAERSTYAAVVRLVRSAGQERPPLVRLADRWALWFLLVTLALGGGAWWLAGDATRALAVLVVATPCPLILAAPVALICGVSRAARRGIIVKGPSVLERLARARTVLFDKTGTLTGGTPRVTGVETLDGFDPDDMLRRAASLAQVSQHAVAGAIVSAARSLELDLILPHDAKEVPGGGLTGTVQGTRVLVGSAGLLDAAGIAPPTEGSTARMAAAASSAAWVALDGRIAGVLLLADRIRPETPRALRALRQAGMTRLVMVSGDRASSVEAVASALGLDAAHADLSPAGKIGVVRAERANAPTVMVGDGINDAPALAAADVGVAMGARGAAAAAEAADVVLLVDRLDRIAEAVTIAGRALGIALQSIGVGMALSGVAMAVAAAGYLPPVAGALLQEVIDVAVILNALRVLTGETTPRPLTDRAAVGRVVEEHARLRGLLDHMRRTADRMDQPVEDPMGELRSIDTAMTALLLPHQLAEEQAVFPELASRLGGRDPLGAMNRMHEEIVHLATRFASLVRGLSDAGVCGSESREVRRLLYALDAIITLHLAAEEELLSQVEDLPARP